MKPAWLVENFGSSEEPTAGAPHLLHFSRPLSMYFGLPPAFSFLFGSEQSWTCAARPRRAHPIRCATIRSD